MIKKYLVLSSTGSPNKDFQEGEGDFQNTVHAAAASLNITKLLSREDTLLFLGHKAIHKFTTKTPGWMNTYMLKSAPSKCNH